MVDTIAQLRGQLAVFNLVENIIKDDILIIKKSSPNFKFFEKYLKLAWLVDGQVNFNLDVQHDRESPKEY